MPSVRSVPEGRTRTQAGRASAMKSGKFSIRGLGSPVPAPSSYRITQIVISSFQSNPLKTSQKTS